MGTNEIKNVEEKKEVKEDTSEVKADTPSSKEHLYVKTLSILLLITTILLAISVSYIVYDHSIDKEVEELQRQAVITPQAETEENPVDEMDRENINEIEEIDTTNWVSYTDDSTTTDTLNPKTWIFSDEIMPGALTPADRNIPVKVSLKHPSDWEKANEYEFENREGRKIFSVAPGGLILLEGKNCFENLEDEYSGIDGSSSTLITQKDEKIGANDVVVRVEKVTRSQIGDTYMHRYCVKYDENALWFTFLEYDMSTIGERNELFDAVIETLIVEDSV